MKESTPKSALFFSKSAAESAVQRGNHAHLAGGIRNFLDPNDMICLGGGNGQCPIFDMGLEEAMETWTDSTT